MFEDAEARVFDLLARKSGIPRSQIDPHAELVRDLGIDGDDATEILIALAKEFAIDMQDFESGRYFRSEPNIFSIFKDSSGEKSARIPVTVLDLVRAARVHRWLADKVET